MAENAIVDYLEREKRNYHDYGLFLQVGEPFNVDAEGDDYDGFIQVDEASTEGAERINSAKEQDVNKLIKPGITSTATIIVKLKEALNKLNVDPVNEPIKLIILKLKNKTLELDCDAFLLDAEHMNKPNYIESLNHVIIGKRDDEYTVIGYVENTIKRSTRIKNKTCKSFKLQTTKFTGDTCVLLPEIIKETIFKCINAYYKQKIPQKIPQKISDYYNPTTKDYKEQVKEENVSDAKLAAAAAAAEITDADKCDFKALLKSKIKNNESHDYCKVTDPDLLARMQQNIDENKVDVDVSGLNDLIKTRLDNSKKVKEEEEEDEDEEKEREDGKKTISENKEANMIREANEMFMISRKVLSKGATYSSSKFFNNYLKNTMVNVKEKEAEPVATVPQAPALVSAVVASAAPVVETTVAAPAAPVAPAVTAATAATAGPKAALITSIEAPAPVIAGPAREAAVTAVEAAAVEAGEEKAATTATTTTATTTTAEKAAATAAAAGQDNIKIAEAAIRETIKTKTTSPEAAASDATGAVPGPKEETPKQKQRVKKAAKEVIKKSRKKQLGIDAFTYAVKDEQNHLA